MTNGMKLEIRKDYFNYLKSFVIETDDYDELFYILYTTDFIYTVSADENRAIDGLDLRYRFAEHNGYSRVDIAESMNRNCTLLEMMVALAIRCEESIMADSYYGDRTPEWFWKMIDSMGLIECTNENCDDGYVRERLDDCMHRNYDRNGRGGYFYIKGIRKDMRKAEIWYQLLYYLDSICDYTID